MTGSPSSSERELLQFAPAALLEVSLNGVIRSHNPALPQWLGASEHPEPNMLIGRNLVDWFTRSGRLHYESILMPKLLLQGELLETVLEVNSEKYGVYSLMLNAKLTTDAETGDRRIFLALIHADERIRFEQGLIAAQRSAEIAQERLSILQEATSRLAVAEGLEDLGTVLTQAAASATHAAWSCVVLAGAPLPAGLAESQSSAGSEEQANGVRVQQIWGTTPDFTFPILDLVQQHHSGIFRSPQELRTGFPMFAAELEAAGVEAVMVTPIVKPKNDHRDEVLLGAIFNLFRRGRSLEAEVTETLSALAGQAERVIEHLSLQDQLRHRALSDTLTGLANRAFFEERLEHIIASSQRSFAPCALFFLDLDGFKTINDELGHGVGDEVLQEVAHRLTQSCRPSETICRLGGDEFVIVAERIDGDAVSHLAQRILQAIRAPLTDIAADYLISASIGVLRWQPVPHSAAPSAVAMLAAADSLMYESKRSGKNTISLCDWADINASPESDGTE